MHWLCIICELYRQSAYKTYSFTNKYTTVKAIRSNDFKLVSVTRPEKTCFYGERCSYMTAQSFLNWLSIKTICFCLTLRARMEMKIHYHNTWARAARKYHHHMKRHIHIFYECRLTLLPIINITSWRRGNTLNQYTLV